MINQVPELYDGGWWYVAATLPNDPGIDNGLRPDLPAMSMTARYFEDGGETYALVRMIEPANVPDAGLTAPVAKSRARIGGL